MTNGRRTLYLDASALVKLVHPEAETVELEASIGTDDTLTTSAIGVVELRRVVERVPDRESARRRWESVSARIEVVELTAEAGDLATTVPPASLRTLDAIHLATALLLKAELDAFVVYDRRLAAAATALGLPVASPGAAG